MSYRQRAVPAFKHVLPIGGSVGLHDRSGYVSGYYRSWTGIAPIQNFWRASKPNLPWARISRISKNSYRWSVNNDLRPWKYLNWTNSGTATTYCAAFEACFAAKEGRHARNTA